MGGIALSNFGLLAGITETTANTEETPTVGIQVVGQPSYSRDESFDAPEILKLAPDFTPGDRFKRKRDLSFQAAVTYMADLTSGELANLCVWEASGWEVYDRAGVAGSGNYLELRFVDTPTKAATFYGYLKEAGAGKLSRVKHIGTRGNGTFVLEPGAGNAFRYDFEGGSKWAFWEEFAVVASPPTLDTSLLHKASCWSATIAGVTVPLISFSATPGFEIALDPDQVTNCASGASDIPLEAGAANGAVSLKFDEDLITTSGGSNVIRDAIESNADVPVIFTRNDGVQLFSLTMPKVRLTEIGLGEGNDRLQFDCTMAIQPDAGGDAMTARWEIL